ncbi:MAG: hypothetical protein WDO73_24905 [Ignavibacteriota bacterium]
MGRGSILPRSGRPGSRNPLGAPSALLARCSGGFSGVTSAGGYISLILLLENPEELFATSRAVIFGSAVPARALNLLSPLILDSAADAALTRMYVRHVDKLPGPRIQHWFQAHGEGKWIRALSGLKVGATLIEQRLRQIGDRISGHRKCQR